MKRFYFFLLKTDYFNGFKRFLKKQKLKRKFSYNLGQNIRRLCHFLAQLFFTTSEMELDYFHKEASVGVAPRVAERLKTKDLRKLGDFQKISEMLGFDGEYPAVKRKVKF